jgi:hypothetical protein
VLLSQLRQMFAARQSPEMSVKDEQKPAATVLREGVACAGGIDELERDREGPDPAWSRVTHIELWCQAARGGARAASDECGIVPVVKTRGRDRAETEESPEPNQNLLGARSFAGVLETRGPPAHTLSARTWAGGAPVGSRGPQVSQSPGPGGTPRRGRNLSASPPDIVTGLAGGCSGGSATASSAAEAAGRLDLLGRECPTCCAPATLGRRFAARAASPGRA